MEVITDKHGEKGFRMVPENEEDQDAFEQWCHLLARPWEVTDYEYDEEKEHLISLTFSAN